MIGDHRLPVHTVLLAAMAAAACGCNPRVVVSKDPGHLNTGVRYYRPKPYLLITPIGTEVEVEANGKSTTTRTPSDRFVNIELEYLPDFEEEYSIKVRPGLGSANVSFKLEDGWNLTEMNQELDTQFDENVSAIADLLSAAGGIAAKAGAGGTGTTTIAKRWAVRATNVPIGYYEAVVNRDPCGRKRLYGWRYVGFAPFNSCPLQVTGGDAAHCANDPDGPIYGLVFECGAITFKPLNMLHADPTPVEVPVVTATTGIASTPSTDMGRSIKDAIVEDDVFQGLQLAAKQISIAVDGNTITIAVEGIASDGTKQTLAQLADAAARQKGIDDPEIAFKNVEVLPTPNSHSRSKTRRSNQQAPAGPVLAIRDGESHTSRARPRTLRR